MGFRGKDYRWKDFAGRHALFDSVNEIRDHHPVLALRAAQAQEQMCAPFTWVTDASTQTAAVSSCGRCWCERQTPGPRELTGGSTSPLRRDLEQCPFRRDRTQRPGKSEVGGKAVGSEAARTGAVSGGGRPCMLAQ